MNCDEIDPYLRARIAGHLADYNSGGDEARELLVEIADALEIDFRRLFS